MTTLIGTNCFYSFAAACRYYSVYEEDLTLEELGRLVRSKEAEGGIQIGKPKLEKGQKLVLVDDETRYAIEES